MADVIDLDAHRYNPHNRGEARCLDCGHTWQAIAPVGVCRLQCSVCMTMRGVWCGHVSSAGPKWQCNACQGFVFELTPDGLYCVTCGGRATGWYIGQDDPPKRRA